MVFVLICLFVVVIRQVVVLVLAGLGLAADNSGLNRYSSGWSHPEGNPPRVTEPRPPKGGGRGRLAPGAPHTAYSVVALAYGQSILALPGPNSTTVRGPGERAFKIASRSL